MYKFIIASLISTLLLLAVACNSTSGSDPGKVIKSGSAGNNLTVELSNASGVLKHGNEEFFVTFKDSTGKPVDVGAVALNFFMPSMGAMPAMNKAVTFTTTGTPGIYLGKTNLEMAGEWQAQISYEGPSSNGKATLAVTAQ